MRVANEGLKFAEAIGVDGDADILYMLENINKVYNVYHGKRKLGKWTLEKIIYTDDLTLEFKNEEDKLIFLGLEFMNKDNK